MAAKRPSWTARSPRGQLLTIEHDPFRRTWRVTPGGYERRQLERAIAQATGDAPNAPWIAQLAQRLSNAVAETAREAAPLQPSSDEAATVRKPGRLGRRFRR